MYIGGTHVIKFVFSDHLSLITDDVSVTDLEGYGDNYFASLTSSNSDFFFYFSLIRVL